VIDIDSRKEFKDLPRPYWIASAPETNYPNLDEDIRVDVAIVGGGIAGISSAYLLAREGLKVAVIEANRILQGTTGHTTAKITSQHSLIYARLKKEMGSEKAQQYAQANESAIRFIASIVQENHIDCDFACCPAYLYTQSDNYLKDIRDEFEAASSLGLKASYLEEIPLSFPVKAALRFNEQAHFHPLKYLQFLAEEIIKQGSYIFEQSQAINIEKGSQLAVISSDKKRVTCSQIIIASHFPFYDGGGLYFSRIYAERSYVLGVKIAEDFPEEMFISAESPIRSLRSQPYEDGQLILIGGESHKTGQDHDCNDHYKNLLAYARNTFEVLDVPYRWSTQDCMTIDGIPFVGHISAGAPDIYVCSGFGKWGMSNGTAAAMIVKDLIVKGESPWAPVYNPSRLTLPSITTLASQNLNVAKHFILGKLKPAAENAQITKGEAQIINVDGQKAGAYRDENGSLHIVDITCTHLGCELAWNNAERSWDCPCHGSRFGYCGEIIEGPALNHLNYLEEGPNKVEPNILS